MLTPENVRRGRVRITPASEYANALARTSSAREGDVRWVRASEIVLDRLITHGKFSFPYPDMSHYGLTVVLSREQTEALAVGLLRRLAPGGELPTDAAELLDFVAALLHRNQEE